MGMMIQIFGRSDTGRRHATNDDQVFPDGPWPTPYALPDEVVAQRGYLAAVADGVSTAALGAAASRCALEALVGCFYDPETIPTEAGLEDAFLAANQAAWELTANGDTGTLAATTLVAALIRDDVAQIMHVGDSRAYLVTPDQVVCLTTDHSIVQEMLERGEITALEADEHPDSGILTRALGLSGHLRPETVAPVTLRAGDGLLLCSDGLSTLVSAEEMGQIVRSAAPMRAAAQLIDLANRRGGYDNISVVIAKSAKPTAWWQRLLR